MIDDFRDDRTGSFEEKFAEAEKALRAGDPAAARAASIAALSHFDAPERDLVKAVRVLLELSKTTGAPRSALACALFLGDHDALDELANDLAAADRGRVFSLLADTEPGERTAAHSRAAREFVDAGRLVRAAFECEAGGRTAEAGALFARVVDAAVKETGAYVEGLARFHAWRCSRDANRRSAGGAGANAGSADSADVWLAVERFEQAAEEFHERGESERAFDCYQMLVAIGRATGTVEHELEGLVNAVRVLADDDRRAHALSLYGRAVTAAERAGEFVAAATLAKDHADYAHRHGLVEIARRATNRRAVLFRQAAHAGAEASAPPRAVESAYLASAAAYAEIGAYEKVGDVYRALARMTEDASRRSYYGRAALRYSGKHDAETFEETPADEEAEEAVPAFSRDDLLEWENRGSAVEACLDVLVDPDVAPRAAPRRAALVAALAAIAAETAGAAEMDSALEVVAARLAPVELYRTLAPLETLAEHRAPAVRLAAVLALSRYAFKRTFTAIERALGDPDRAVVSAARRAVERLRFAHAFEPLRRLYRGAPDPESRLAALRALGRLDHPGARALVEGVREHGTDAERAAIRGVLSEGRAQG